MICLTPQLLADAPLPAAPVGEGGARPDVVYEVTVEAAEPGPETDALRAQGLNVVGRDGNSIRLRVNASELAWLSIDGYTVTILEEIPPEPEAPPPGSRVLGQYHDYATLTSELIAYAAAYGPDQNQNNDICRLHTLGQTVQGREIWALLITDNPDVQEDEPEFKYVATIHGDEPLGTELCMYLIDELLTQYHLSTRHNNLVNNTAIWFVPMMNPDGLQLNRRENANGVDLNRNFPDWPSQFAGTVFDGAPLNTAGRQPETQRMMEWTAANNFVMSANFHGGAFVMNYVYDDDNKGTGNNAPTPDDALVRHLSRLYSLNHTTMSTNSYPQSPDGIINGSQWYEITGGMMDWHYRYAGCIDVTIELSTLKRPAEFTIPNFWNANHEAMLAYMEGVHIGVRGVVRNSSNNQPLYAKITINGNPQPVFTDPDVGDYQRLLLPGTYSLTVESNGFTPKTINGVSVASGPATRLDVTLDPLPIDADVDGDGDVDATDLQFIVLKILGQTVPGHIDADLDDNGSVNSVDLQLGVLALLQA
ncbi:MAG: hypothetical protein AMXMBFR84_28540 [Candidatus Hydrogenedentota bacterium]